MTVKRPVAGRFDVVIGGGAAGPFCAAVPGARGRSVPVDEHANKVGKKILMSGGGRCNFSNLHSGPDNFLSANPHFCKSALSRYTTWDFVSLVGRHGIDYREKKLGQLFCDGSSKQIIAMLRAECAAAGVAVHTHCPIGIEQLGPPHRLASGAGAIECESLVIATGGYSIPRMGATGFGFVPPLFEPVAGPAITTANPATPTHRWSRRSRARSRSRAPGWRRSGPGPRLRSPRRSARR